jgi:hypothetical protein
MKSLRITAFVAVLAVIAMISLHEAGRAQATNLRILTPAQGAKLTADIVQVSYELINPAAADAPLPTFQLQLDGQDPVQTSSSDYTFTGLAPGQHTVLVELVDANGNPVPGSINAVQFVVLPGQQPGATQPQSRQPAGTNSSDSIRPASMNGEKNGRSPTLPEASSLLPLFSIIGFGVLLGGIVSAMKTR